MSAIRTMWRKFRADMRGATAIEYGLICGLIAVACIAAMKNLGGGSQGMWGRIMNQVVDVMT